MEEMIPVEPNNLPEQADQKVVPVPAEGRKLYITRNSEGFDFRALLGQAVQCLNMADIIAEIKAGTQYVVQIPAQFQEAYESGEMFIMENMKTGNPDWKWWFPDGDTAYPQRRHRSIWYTWPIHGAGSWR